ncbi:glycosyltransferase family 39 protein [uncultured Draconibacterium sp.]|uniref:glycosyltransferase family 39 protein n=1 Tax=uncultured Draconibacterium sp. TaxID=1573823 RepID=UPI0025F3AEC6|nr:glycosyltransferase family 39 protein [uncultured Draconibacterium sp.]
MNFLSIFLAFILGFSFLRWVAGRFSFIEILGLSFPAGMGVVTFIMFLLNVVGIGLTQNSLLLAGGFCLVAFNLRYIIQPQKLVNAAEVVGEKQFWEVGKFNLIWLVLVMAVAGILFFVTKKSLYTPTFSTDSVSSFDLYAKAIASEGSLLNSLISDRSVGFGAAYPPLTSLSLAYAYIFGFQSSKIIPALLFISFVVAFYGLAVKNLSSTAAIMATLGLALSPELLAQSALNTTSVPQAMYASLGLIALFTWYKRKEMKYFYLAVIMLSLNGWIRSEGIVYIFTALLFVFYVHFSEKKFKNLYLLLLSLLPFVCWQLFLKMNAAIMEPFVQVNLSIVPNMDSEYMAKILRGAWKNFFHPSYYGISFYLFAAVIVINVWAVIKKKDTFLLLALILLPLVGYLFLLNQLQLKADSIENIMDASAKRFFFGTVALIWFYVFQIYPLNRFFKGLEIFLGIPEKPKHE